MMGKIKNVFTILTISLGILLILGSTAYADLSGTFSGNVTDFIGYLGGKQGQLTIAITSDVKVGSGSHRIGGTVTLSGFSSCFTQGSFSESDQGLWTETGYYGFIIAQGASFSQAILYFNVSSDLTQILLNPSGTGFKDSGGNFCLFVNAAVLTKQGGTTTPTVSTTAVSEITSNTAFSGGNVTSDGGASVTARGVCWSTSSNPTISDSHTSDGTGTGSFTSSITGLSPSTTYHVKAYATNTTGTAYGNGLTFTTSATPPTVPTEPTLTVTTSGTTVTVSWNAVTNANGYMLSYAPYPYTGPETIVSVDMGTQTGISVNLWEGAAFYVAVQAYNSAGSSGYSNIGYFIIGSPSPTYTNSLGQTFILLPAGTFTMGSPSDEPGRSGAETQHQVTLTQPFYMMTTEVTQAQWEAVMGSNPSYYYGCPTCPVEYVFWNDVQAYIAQMNARGEGTYSLPTEAQWEYAARAGSTTAFANGGITSYSDMYECEYDPNLDAIGWYCYNSGNKTHPVGQKSPNVWGLYDMSGNVYEWCTDWYGSYDSGPVTDPTGPSSSWGRVIRGGDWVDCAEGSRSANRSTITPSGNANWVGFRLLRQPE